MGLNLFKVSSRKKVSQMNLYVYAMKTRVHYFSLCLSFQLQWFPLCRCLVIANPVSLLYHLLSVL